VFGPQVLGTDHHAERHLTPQQYRVLVLLVHAALLVAVAGRGEEPVRQALGGSAQEAPTTAARCWQVLEACGVYLLQRGLVPDGRLDLLGGFLHSLVDQVFVAPGMATPCVQPQQRRDAENAFSAVMAGACADTVGTAGRALELYAEEETPALELELRELRRPASAAHGLLFYRLTRTPNPDAMAAAYYREAIHRERYPIVDVFLRHEARLRLVRHLWPLVDWTNTVRRAKSLQISRQQAREMLHRALWEGPGEAPRVIRQRFSDFQDAWNALRETLACEHCGRIGTVRDECKDVALWPVEAEGSLVLSCLNPADDGKLTGVVMILLAQCQNRFLEECQQAQLTLPVQRIGRASVVDTSRVWESVRG
jgi:hypothetical protein